MFNFIINKKVSLLFISIFAMLTIIACGSDDEMENETSSSAQMDEVAVEEVVEEAAEEEVSEDSAEEETSAESDSESEEDK